MSIESASEACGARAAPPDDMASEPGSSDAAYSRWVPETSGRPAPGPARKYSVNSLERRQHAPLVNLRWYHACLRSHANAS